ncbi:MAG: galactokinase [Chloroflexi bacterium RBG_16_68_14]|nr:MAG: galactokinase [Chloroflexi bacterium RBG_16_68_14]
MSRRPEVDAPPAEERLIPLSQAFQDRFGRAPLGAAEAPGRVNLIGEHVDYNQGLVLPAAIDRSVLVAFAPRPDAEMRLYSLDFDEESRFSLAEPIGRDDAHPWSNYLRAVAWVLAEEGCSGPGLDLVVAGNVLIGAGLSSSAALEVAALGALRAAWGLDLDDRRVALLAQRAENEFVGVQCGIMDQFAAALAVADHALLIDCRSLEYQQVPLPLAERGLALVVADSGLPRRLEESEYNRRREECAEALRLLQAAMTGRRPGSLRDVSMADLEEHIACLPPALFRRARHVVGEMERVGTGVDALRRGDLEAFGGLMNASHASLRDDFEVSCPELDRLTELAQGLSGVLGARLTGAGFGGCTVNLVQVEAVEAFREQVVGRYSGETGLAGRTYVCRAADGLRIWPLASH